MADDGETDAPIAPIEGSTGDDQEPSFAPDHDSDNQSPRPDSQNQPVTADEIKSQQEAVNVARDKVYQQGRKNDADEAALQKELDDIKAAANQKPPPPPVPTALPAPHTQDEKNGIAVATTNILKLGTLVGLAYGLRGRSRNRNAIFKLGLGAALQGYMEGDNAMRNRAATMWEKNRQAINDQNREQHQQYMDTMRDQKLNLQQKMDVFREQAALWQNGRAAEAAQSGSVQRIQKMLDQEMKLQRDFEKQTRELSNQWLGWTGLGKKDGIDYRAWVESKGGPDIAKAKNEDEAYEIEKKYPRHQMLEELAGQKAQQTLEESAAKAGAEETARLNAKEKFDKEKESGGDNPLGLNLGD